MSTSIFCIQPRGKTQRAIVRAVCSGRGLERGKILMSTEGTYFVSGAPGFYTPGGSQGYGCHRPTAEEALQAAFMAVTDPTAILLVYRDRSGTNPIPDQFQGPGRYEGYFICRWNSDVGLFVQLDATYDETTREYTFQDSKVTFRVRTR